MRSGAWSHSARPFFQVSAVVAAYCAALSPLRAASPASTHGSKSVGREIRKRQQQVAEIALRVDADGRDAVDRRFLEQREAQPGLAAAGHADAHRVCGQVLRVIEHQIVPECIRLRIELAPQVEDA